MVLSKWKQLYYHVKLFTSFCQPVLAVWFKHIYFSTIGHQLCNYHSPLVGIIPLVSLLFVPQIEIYIDILTRGDLAGVYMRECRGGGGGGGVGRRGWRSIKNNGDRWIPPQRASDGGKCLHLITSSWYSPIIAYKSRSPTNATSSLPSTFSLLSEFVSVWHVFIQPETVTIYWIVKMNACLGNAMLTHWGRDQWPPFSRRHFQMHFLDWKYVNFD